MPACMIPQKKRRKTRRDDSDDEDDDSDAWEDEEDDWAPRKNKAASPKPKRQAAHQANKRMKVGGLVVS